MTFIREIHMPASCRGFVLEDCNGDYNIYINQDLSPEAKLRTLRHEQTHIRMGDTHSDLPVVDIEERCQNAMQEMPKDNAV